jgi:hypothetical protein
MQTTTGYRKPAEDLMSLDVLRSASTDWGGKKAGTLMPQQIVSAGDHCRHPDMDVGDGAVEYAIHLVNHPFV